MISSTDISFIIPTWNTAQATKNCIDSIVLFTKKLSYEIIVIDNGSTDNTVSLLENDPRIKLIKNDQNFGFSKACNIGAKQSAGKYLFFLNSDMVLVDNKIYEMMKYIDNHRDVGIIGPQFLNPDQTSQPSVFPPQTPLNAFKEFWLKQDSYSKYLPPVNQISSVWSISGGALLISKVLFNQIGGWNENYFFYYEDLDICRQIRKLHKKIVYYPSCQIVHYHGLSGRHLSNENNQWRRLIPSSKKYHGLLEHYLITLIIWSSQKLSKLI